MAKNIDGFARDLGYLDAFFDKLDARGASMGGASGDRLRAFVGEERRRWSEVRDLLAGASTTPVSVSPPEATSEVDITASPRQRAPVSDSAPGFTVGSLRSMQERAKLL